MPQLISIDAIISNAIGQRIFPGAVVLVARSGEIVHQAAYGTTTYELAPQPVSLDTIYDIASLTKMFTATAVLRLIDAGHLALDMPVRALLPRFSPTDITVWHLLTHTSGIDIRLSTLRELGRDGLLDVVYATSPQHKPGTVVAYTNVNSLLLGEIVAGLVNMPLDAALDELLIRPLSLGETCFNPDMALLPRIAPTEIDDTWRGNLVHGTVHDESAHALGGVAGHAGLFSTADDLFRFCHTWLEARKNGNSMLSRAIAFQATTNQTLELKMACGLGWMMDRPNFMGAAPMGSFGHTGFTGPAMVVIPSHDMVVLVLSNRVHPRRGPALHHMVTAAVVEAALAEG